MAVAIVLYSYISVLHCVVCLLALCICFCPHLSLLLVPLTLTLDLSLVLSDWVDPILVNYAGPVGLLLVNWGCI